MSSIVDTSPAAERLMLDAYRRMPPWRKLRQVTQLTQAVQQMALSRMRTQYGTRPEREEKLRLASLWLPRDTMRRWFNWDPSEQGL
jgi:hypothetical protein